MRVLRLAAGRFLALAGILWAIIGGARGDYDTTLAALLLLGSANVLLTLEVLDRLPTVIRLRRGGDTYPVQRTGGS